VHQVGNYCIVHLFVLFWCSCSSSTP